ncbi:MAG: Fur family transcriptional regulator [Gammaproteobacteria bacterium]
MNTQAKVEQELRSHGVKPTPQRIEIGAVLLARPCHMSADQILGALRATGSRVSKATVYNTLNLFSRQGIVREVAVDPTHLVYDSTTAAHHHVFNIDTGELTDIDSDALEINGLPDLPAGTRAESVELIVRVRNIESG